MCDFLQPPPRAPLWEIRQRTPPPPSPHHYLFTTIPFSHFSAPASPFSPCALQYEFAKQPPKDHPPGVEALPAKEGPFGEELRRGFELLSGKVGWANVRDVESVYKALREERDYREIVAETEAEKAGGGEADPCAFNIEAADVAKAFARPQFFNRLPKDVRQAPPPKGPASPLPLLPGQPSLQRSEDRAVARAVDHEVDVVKEEEAPPVEKLEGGELQKERDVPKVDDDGGALGMYPLCELCPPPIERQDCPSRTRTPTHKLYATSLPCDSQTRRWMSCTQTPATTCRSLKAGKSRTSACPRGSPRFAAKPPHPPSRLLSPPTHPQGAGPRRGKVGARCQKRGRPPARAALSAPSPRQTQGGAD